VRRLKMSYGLNDLLKELGYDDFLDFVEEYLDEGCVPGICKNCGEI
jgi:hypothetical protein